MTNRFILFIFYINATALFAQDYSVGMNKSSESIIKSWDEIEPGKTKNSYYFNSDWASFDLYLKTGCLVEGQLMRLNLLTNTFEVKFGSKIKILAADKVEYFEYNDNGVIRLFESMSGYVVKEEYRGGFFEVLVPGDPGLLQKVFLKEKKGESKELLLSKGKNYKLTKAVSYLLLKEGRFAEIPTAKDDFPPFFAEEEQIVTDYIKKYKPDIKDRDDLKKLILFLKKEVW